MTEYFNNECIFFLDGHYSGYGIGRGEKDVPILEEVKIINDLFLNKCIIIIDDFRLFGTTHQQDWSYISKQKILEILKDRVTNVYHLPSDCNEEDRLIIHLNKQHMYII